MKPDGQNEIDNMVVGMLLKHLTEEGAQEFVDKVLSNPKEGIAACYFDFAFLLDRRRLMLVGPGWDDEGKESTVTCLIEFEMRGSLSVDAAIDGPHKIEHTSFKGCRNRRGQHERWIKEEIQVGNIEDIRPACVSATISTLHAFRKYIQELS